MISDRWTPSAWQLAYAQATFEPIHEAELANPQTVDPDELVAFFGSMGWVASLRDEDRQQLLDRMRSQLTATEYVLPWLTRAQWTRLRGPT